MKVKEPIPFKNWTGAEKPREKLKAKGVKSLTKAEMLAILLRRGAKGCNCIEVSRKILAAADNDFDKLGELSLETLQSIYGVGEAQAMVIMAAMEIRKISEPRLELIKVLSSHDAFLRLQDDLAGLRHEEFWALYLNTSSKLVHKQQISSGGISSTVVDPRMVFKIALDKNASSIIVAHNHPSGNLTPSSADLDLTRKLVAAAKLFDIQVVDHLILAGKNYCSFADSGLL
jgi:DNA repair protein RadC